MASTVARFSQLFIPTLKEKAAGEINRQGRS
jgi:hypothetical protein